MRILLLLLFFSPVFSSTTNYSKFEPLQAKVTVIEQKGSMVDVVFNFFIILLFLFAIFFSFFLSIKIKRLNFSDFNKNTFFQLRKMLSPLRVVIWLMIIIGLTSFFINFFVLIFSLKLSLNLILTLNSQILMSVLRTSFQLSIILFLIYLILEKWIAKKISN